MKHLTVGLGEVGKAIYKIVGGFYTTHGDNNWNFSDVEAIHICIPYSQTFNKQIKRFKKFSNLIIVHSTVPVGTCDKLEIVHSPIRGVHPNLEEGIRTFVKYFGGKNAKKAAKIFSDLGIPTKILKNARTTEALKLWDTTQYGKLITLEKEIFEWCKKNKISFKDIYQDANKNYNEGYIKLGKPEVVRPFLKHIDGPIGGHCIIPNAKMLGVKL